MADTFRALCAELANYLQGRKDLECGWGEEDPEHDLLDRARAALAQSEPEGPSDDELDYLWAEIDGGPDCCAWRPYARAILTRYARPAIEPVQVSERLPGEGDCDPSFQCWWFTPSEEKWILWPIKWAGPECSHWLPHHALPVPTTRRDHH